VPPVDLPPVTERGGGRRTAGATQFGEHHPAGAGTTSHQAPHRPRDQALGEQTPAGNGQAAGGRRRSDHPALAQPSTTPIAPRQGSCKTDGKMEDDYLANSLLVNIEGEILETYNYEDVIEDFKKKNRKADL
jgi:hypothetical protein